MVLEPLICRKAVNCREGVAALGLIQLAGE
jgi:hypothetical protein